MEVKVYNLIMEVFMLNLVPFLLCLYIYIFIFYIPHMEGFFVTAEYNLLLKFQQAEISYVIWLRE